MRNLLVLGKGDTPYSDRNRVRFIACARQAGFDVQTSDYHEIDHVPGFRTGQPINAMFFFPYTFWNAHCEVPEDTGLYGTSRKVYDLFSVHFRQVQEQLEQRFGTHNLHYVIPPENAPVDRDKVETIRRLRVAGVPTSEPVAYTSLSDIIDSVTPERGVFIKCRYGAEGKGITVLHRGRWVTNYRVDGDKLANNDTYGLWPFVDVTGKHHLLEQLLAHDLIVEREILTPDVFNGKKFDLRAYVVGQEVPHFFVRVNDPNKVVTNFSQGAKVNHHPNTGLPEDCITLVKETAKRAAKALGLEFVGVDIMFDGTLTNGRVVEVQAFTDFPDNRKFEMAKYMASDASGLLI